MAWHRFCTYRKYSFTFIMNENDLDRSPYDPLKRPVDHEHEIKQSPPVYHYPKEQLRKAIEGIGKRIPSASITVQEANG